MPGGGGESDFNAGSWVDQANSFLSDALMLGLPYSERFMQQAVDATEYANKQSRIDQEKGYNMAQGLQAPYRLAGYTALDSYLDSLTLARPEMGNFKLANALESNAKRDAAISQLGLDTEKLRKDYGIAWQNIGEIDPETGRYYPGVFLDNFVKISDDMLKNDWLPWSYSPEYTQGYRSLSQAPAGISWARRPGTDGNNSFPDTSSLMRGGTTGGLAGGESGVGGYSSRTALYNPEPSTPYEQFYWARDKAQQLQNDYLRSIQYYTPEHGSIAASFNKGLLGDPVWANVGGDNPYLGPAAARTGREQ